MNTKLQKFAIVVAILTAAGCQGDQGDNAQAPPATSSVAAPSSTIAASISAAAGQDDQLALQILDAVVRADFNAATARFDAVMKERLTPEQLGSAWTTYQEAFGKYQSHGDPHDVPFGDLTVVNVPLQMERMPGEFRVTFHPDATVAGLYFLKTGVPVS